MELGCEDKDVESRTCHAQLVIRSCLFKMDLKVNKFNSKPKGIVTYKVTKSTKMKDEQKC